MAYPGEVLIRKIMHPLDELHLLSADAPLLTFVENADKRPYCLVLDGERINGIVTLSDIQKLTVRPALFLLITHLELLVTERMRVVGESVWREELAKQDDEQLLKKFQKQVVFFEDGYVTALCFQIIVSVR